jgi:hypothetical protein
MREGFYRRATIAACSSRAWPAAGGADHPGGQRAAARLAVGTSADYKLWTLRLTLWLGCTRDQLVGMVSRAGQG